MEKFEFTLSFPDASPAQANQWAGDLKQHLEEAHREVRIRLKRERDDTMDLGGILEIVLGSVAVKEVAKALHVWLAKRHEASIEIGKDGAKITGLRVKDAADLAERILKSQKP